MKKLIAISVLFALLTGAAFAQVSGLFRAKWWVIDGAQNNGVDPVSTASVDAAHIQLTAKNDEGTIGGTVRFRRAYQTQTGQLTDISDPTSPVPDPDQVVTLSYDSMEISHYWAWWAPIKQLKFYIGQNTDGFWEYPGLVGWAFHKGDADFGHMDGYAFANGTVDSFKSLGFGTEIKPVDGLEFDLGFNIGYKTPIDLALSRFFFKGSFAIPNVGTAILAFNSTGYARGAATFGNAGIGFDLTAIPNLPMVLLVSLGIPSGDAPSNYVSTINVSYGVAYTVDDFDVRLRLQTGFGNNFNGLTAQIMPSYNFGFMQAHLNLGLGINGTGDTFTFKLNPYVTKTIGNGKIGAALQVTFAGSTTTLSVPITFAYNF